MARTILRIDGMSCDHCIRTLTDALGTLKGVSKVEVSLAEGKATLDHSDGSPSLKQMIAAVEEEGYSASAA